MSPALPEIHAGLLSHALWAMAAVALYAALQHLVLVARGAERTLHLSFVAMAFAVAVNLAVSAGAYQTFSIPDLVLAVKVMNTSACVFVLGFLWFLPAYAGHDPRGFKAFSAPLILILMALVWLRPEGILFDRVEAIVPWQTPWGETLAVARGRYSAWSRVYPVLFTVFLGVGFRLAWRLEKNGRRERARWLALGLGLLATGLLFTALHDFRGERGKLRGVEFGFMAVIVLMSGSLAVEAAEAQRARSLLRRMAADAALAEERERRRLAAGLHDSPLQKIALARMQIERHCQAPAAAASLALLDEAMEELRHALFELSPALLYDAGLDAALAQLALDLAGHSGLAVRFRAEGTEPELDEAGRTALYRGARELMMNALKHAGATNLLIERLNPAGAVALRVSDDGAGFDVRDLARHRQSGRHFGLLGLEENMAALGGRYEIESGAAGTRVTLTLQKAD